MKNRLILKDCEVGKRYIVAYLGRENKKNLTRIGLYCGIELTLNVLNDDNSAVITVGNQKISLGSDIVEQISVTDSKHFVCKNANNRRFRRKRRFFKHFLEKI